MDMRGGRLREQMTQVFARIEHEIIPNDEKMLPGQYLFSVLVGPGAMGGFDCEQDETAYCQRIDVQDRDGSIVQVVLVCGCAERPEWAFLLHYLVDAAAERLRIILLERKGAFLLGSDFLLQLLQEQTGGRGYGGGGVPVGGLPSDRPGNSVGSPLM